MPKFRVLEKCFIDNHLRQEGDVIEYNGPDADILEPVDNPASKELVSTIEKPVAKESHRKKWMPKSPKDAEPGTV